MWSFISHCFRRNRNRYTNISSTPTGNLSDALLMDVHDEKRSDAEEKIIFPETSERGLRVTSTSETFLALTIQKEFTPDEKKSVSLTKQETESTYEISRKNVAFCIGILTAHQRTNILKAMAPGLILNLAGAIVAIYRAGIVHHFSSAYNDSFQQFSQTWANYSVVPYGSPSSDRQYYHRNCLNVNYPAINYRYYLHDHHTLFRYNDESSCWGFEDYIIDLSNTTGLEICTQLLTQFCHAYHLWREDDSNIVWKEAILILIAISISCYLYAYFDFYARCVHPSSSIRNTNFFKLKLDSDALDDMYRITKENDIFMGNKQQFQEYLSSNMSELLEKYQTAHAQLKANYLSRLTFLKGFSRSPNDMSSMQVCMRPSPEENRFDFSVIQCIFEYAGIEKDREKKCYERKQAKGAIFDATHVKNNNIPLNSFFRRLQQKDNDGKAIYNEEAVIRKIFNFVG